MRIYRVKGMYQWYDYGWYNYELDIKTNHKLSKLNKKLKKHFLLTINGDVKDYCINEVTILSNRII